MVGAEDLVSCGGTVIPTMRRLVPEVVLWRRMGEEVRALERCKSGLCAYNKARLPVIHLMWRMSCCMCTSQVCTKACNMIRLLPRAAGWRGRYCRIKGNRCNWRSSVSFLCIAVKVVGRRLWTWKRVIGWRNLLQKGFFSPRRAYCLSRGLPYCDFVCD